MKIKLLFSILLLCVFVRINSYAQTTLSAGDVALIGFSTDNPDQFVFLLLVDVESGTQINFTDRGWNTTLGTFNTGEGTLTWTATSNLTAGTYIDILDLDDPFTADIGTITDDNNFELSGAGDQILVYQGTDLSPTFLNAIHMDNGDGGWSNATGTNSTALPPGLIDGVHALYFGEIDNGSFTCPSDPIEGDATSALEAIMTISNWELENGPFNVNPVLGGNCTFNFKEACVEATVSNRNVIYGNVYNDLNRNEILDTGEAGQGAVTINLYQDINGNGIIDGADSIVQSTNADGVGDYTFSIIPTTVPNLTFSKQIDQGIDDAQEEGNNSVVTDGTELKFKLGDPYVGLRFRNIDIPKGATINTATITFVAKDSQTGFLSYDISAEASDNASEFQEINNNISDRWDASNIVPWHNMVDWFENLSYQTPDISSLIESVVARPGWNNNNSLAIIFKHFAGPNNERKFESFEKNSSTSPVLNINYDGYLPESYIITIDETSIPSNKSLTTVSTIPVAFTSIEEVSCRNNFGLAFSRSTLDFDGVDDYAEANSVINGLSEYTVSAWVKYNGPTLGTNDDVFVLGQKDVFEISIRTWATANNPTYYALQGKTFLNNSPFLGVASGWRSYRSDWTHITVTVKQNGPNVEAKVYRNGYGSTSPGSLPGVLSTNSEPLRLGIVSGANDFEYNFEGWMDEIRIFDIALTDDQVQRMVYQEIENNAGYVHGSVIPKDIVDISTGTKIPWNNLVAYYPLNDIKNNKTSDYSTNNNELNLYNITSYLEQTAPMPFETVSDGDWTQESTWLHGDVWDIEYLPNFNPYSQSPEPWSIVHIKNNVTTSRSHRGIGLLIDANKSLTVNGNDEINNSWYFELNGTLDLQSDSQLVQTNTSDLVTSSTGKIKRRQEGLSSVYRYNYWGSPVGTQSATVLTDNNTVTSNNNNTSFTLNMLKDASGSNVQFTNAYHEDGKISSNWLYSYQNGVSYYDWDILNPSTPIQSGTGYTQKGGGSLSQYIFEGKPNNGTIILNAIDTGGSGSVGGVSKTEYLIGNPYPSAIDGHQFIIDNSTVISGEIYLWEQWAGDSHILNAYEGGYATLNLLGSVKAYQFVGLNGANNGSQDGIKTPTRYLPVAQGFMVEVVNDEDIVFNNTQRVFKTEASGDSMFFKTQNTQEQSDPELAAAIQKIRLEFKTSNNLGRELLLGFSPTTTDGFDYGYDAKVYETNVNDLTMSLNNDNTVIQAFSSITSDKVVDLNFTTDGLATYTIKAIALENIESTQEIYLLDNLTGVYHDLTSNQDYNFTSEAGEYTDRFDIVFQNKSATLGVEDYDSDSTLVYYSNTQELLFVKGLNQEVKSTTVYNAIGQEVYNNTSLTNQQLENGIRFANLSTGLYIVSIKTENNLTIDKKIIIK